METDLQLPCPHCSRMAKAAEDLQHALECEKCGEVPMSDYRQLSDKRRDDRKRMLSMVGTMCDHFGVKYDVSQRYLNRNDSLALHINADCGLRVNVCFNGAQSSAFREGNVYVLAWNIEPGSANRISRSFSPEANPLHRRKATEVAYGCVALMKLLYARLKSIADGTAVDINQT